jgi:hypothetical protein
MICILWTNHDFASLAVIPVDATSSMGSLIDNLTSTCFIRDFTARYMHNKEIENYAQKNSNYEN